MAQRFPLPNGAVVEIASAFGADKVISALTNAAPPVATSVAHALVDGAVGLLQSGWSKIDGRAIKTEELTADTFSLLGLDTSDDELFTAGSGVGAFSPATSWAQISKITSFALAGGDQQFLTVGYLEDDDDRQFPINRNPMTLTIAVEDQPEATYVPVVESFDESKILTIIRLRMRNGDVILYPGYVSITSSPTMERNAQMTRTITVGITGRPMRYLAA